MKKSPVQKVKEKFGSKDKLVEEILALIKKPSEQTKEELKKILRSQSNTKLVTLLQRETKVKDQFGGRDNLIEALLKSHMGKDAKEDKDYRKQLASLGAGRLLDLARQYKVKG